MINIFFYKINGQVCQGHWKAFEAEVPPMIGDLVDGNKIIWDEILKRPEDHWAYLEKANPLVPELERRTYRVKGRRWRRSNLVHVFLENISDAEMEIVLSYYQKKGLT